VTRTDRRSRLVVFFASWALLSLLSCLWSLATPLGGAPDEPAHLIKAAAVVRGEFTGTATPKGTAVEVPKYIAWTAAQTCYAFNSEVAASCSPDVPGNTWKTTKSTTTAGLYNPMYYVLVGWPSLIFENSTGVFAMRFVSAILCSLFLAIAFMLVSGWRRRTLPILGLVVAITPMVLFLNGTVSPNGLEVTATLATFVGMLSVIFHPDPALLRLRTILIIVAACVAANCRGLSVLWVAVAILAPLILASRQQIVELLKTRIIRIAIAIVAVGVVLALLWLATSNSLIPAPSAHGAVTVPYMGASALFGFAFMLAKTISYMGGEVGIFGWLDTPAPGEVYIVWAVFVGGLVVWALSVLRGRKLVFTLAIGAAFVLLPAIAQASFIHAGGLIWQGRYTLPLFVMLVVGISAVLADQFSAADATTTRRLSLITIGLWAIAVLLAFAVTLRRYATGTVATLEHLLHPAWQPPLGLIGMGLLFAVAVVGSAIVVYRFATPRREKISPAA
jgi:Predicted membrane protein (DUF2142)